MLDNYVNAVMAKVSGVIAAVGAQRHEWERQRGGDRHAQSYLGTALKHPDAHTTPLRKSAERAQQEYASLRAEWAKVGPQMVTLFASLMIARERRDETKAVWERHDAEEQRRRATKYHPELRRLFAQFHSHGVTPAMLDLLRPETIGIIADLILWDAFDRNRVEPGSPLPAVLNIYADRAMMMPVNEQTVTRSAPGIAPLFAEDGGPVYYQFGRLDVPSGTRNGTHETSGGVPMGHDLDEAAADHSIEPREDQGADLPEPPVIMQAEAATASLSVDSATALEWAERIADMDPQFMASYWPRGQTIDDYDPRTLIPALEDDIASGRGWVVTPVFLAAVQEGRGVEFMAERRQSKIRWLAGDIEAGKEDALMAVRDAGLL